MPRHTLYWPVCYTISILKKKYVNNCIHTSMQCNLELVSKMVSKSKRFYGSGYMLNANRIENGKAFSVLQQVTEYRLTIDSMDLIESEAAINIKSIVVLSGFPKFSENSADLITCPVDCFSICFLCDIQVVIPHDR